MAELREPLIEKGKYDQPPKRLRPIDVDLTFVPRGPEQIAEQRFREEYLLQYVSAGLSSSECIITYTHPASDLGRVEGAKTPVLRYSSDLKCFIESEPLIAGPGDYSSVFIGKWMKKTQDGYIVGNDELAILASRELCVIDVSSDDPATIDDYFRLFDMTLEKLERVSPEGTAELERMLAAS